MKAPIMFVQRALICTATPLLFCACTLLEPRPDPAELQRQKELAREREQRRFFEEQHRKVSRSMEDLDAAHYELSQKVVSVESKLSREQAATTEELNRRIADLEQKLLQLEQQQTRNRDEIINTLTQRVNGIVKTQAAENARRYQQALAASGAEHIVGSGENLSAIASAYGVSMQAIIKANNITNPNALRVGQKLIIPR